MQERNLFAVVLAAGAARRFGAQKLLATYAGAPLAARAVRTAESLCGARSVLVTGSDWRAVAEACAPLEGFLVRNEDWRAGLGSSIAAGVRPLVHRADALLLLLGDQPLVTTGHLEALVARWEGVERRIVATEFAGVAGPPVLFPAWYFGVLASLTGDRGARAVLARAPGNVETVRFEPASVDIDRPEDLAGLGSAD